MLKKIIIPIFGILLLFSMMQANEYYFINKHQCIGCMQCINICPVNAIKAENGRAVIDPEKCIACGLCIDGVDNYKGCPSNAISPQHTSKQMNKKTSIASESITTFTIRETCIGCELCIDQCPTEAISMVNNKAVIDQEKCIQCGLCFDGNGDDYEGCPIEAIEKKE